MLVEVGVPEIEIHGEFKKSSKKLTPLQTRVKKKSLKKLLGGKNPSKRVWVTVTP